MNLIAYAWLTFADRIVDGREHIETVAQDDRCPDPVRRNLQAALDHLCLAEAQLRDLSEGDTGQ